MINNPFHPAIFLKELIDDADITTYRLSKDLHVPQTRISQILKQKRGISVDTAMRLAAYFGTTNMYWLNLQASYDIAQHSIEPITALAS